VVDAGSPGAATTASGGGTAVSWSTAGSGSISIDDASWWPRAREEASRRADRAEAQNDQLIRDLAALRAQLTQVSQDLADANTRVARRGRVGGS